MKLLKKAFGVFALLCLLILIRLYEAELFYDPLRTFFMTDHTTDALPGFQLSKLLLHLFFRFLLNTLISLGVLWIVFRSVSVLKFSAILYGIFFVVLFVLFFLLVQNSEAGEHLPLFYVRRFLIQPLLLFFLLPAFYVQRISNKNER